MSDQVSERELGAALSGLAKMVSARRRAEQACERIYAELEAQGFSRASIDRVLMLLDSDARETFDELKQAQSLLERLKAPVQIELTSLYETPVSEAHRLCTVQDEGYWARVCGLDRIFRGSNQRERASWMAGYDEADRVFSE